MSYNYKISFNSSDYLDLVPTNNVEFTTKADEGTFIYRTEVDEIKINRHLNTTIYDTLESYWDDSSKYSIEIIIRKYKGTTVKWEGVFGIKQGRINKEQTFYIIKPETNDVYRRIFQFWKRTLLSNADLNIVILINERTTFDTKTEISAGFYQAYVEKAMERIQYDSGVLYDHKSSKLWNDNYPSGDAPPVGYHITVLDTIQITPKFDYTVEEVLNMSKFLNCFWYVDENEDLRIEHLEYFEDLINDYEINLTDDLNVVPEYQTIEAEVYAREKLDPPNFAAVTDWDRAIVNYLAARTTFKDQQLEIKSDVTTFLETDGIEDEDSVMMVTAVNLLSGFSATSFGTWEVVSGAGFTNITGVASGSLASATGNLIPGAGDYSYSVTVTYSSGANNLRIKSDTAAAVVLAEGENSGTIAVGDNGYIAFDTVGACNFQLTVTITRTGEYRVPWSNGIISSNYHANAYLSNANVFNIFHLHGRQSRSGTMNGAPKDFKSTVYNKRQKEFKTYIEDDIDPLHGVLTEAGIARIESYKRDDNDYVTLTLIYQENE